MFIKVGTAFYDEALAIEHIHILYIGAEGKVYLTAGDSRCTRAADHYFYVGQFFTYDPYRIEQGSSADYCGTMLVIMHYRYAKLLFKPRFYFKTLWGLYVFQVYAAECRL